MIVSKTEIERLAKAAAQAGQSISDACPYPLQSEAAMHFQEAYLLARTEPGSKVKPTSIQAEAGAI